jgi:hypothetical protein
MLFRVIPCFLAYSEATKKTVMLEELLDGGEFVKYMGNDGFPSENALKTMCGETMLALAHWSYIFGKGDFLITDLQGILV